MTVRNPRQREHRRRFVERTTVANIESALNSPAGLAAIARKRGQDPATAYEQLKSIVDNKELTLSVGTNWQLKMEILTMDRELQHLAARKWTIGIVEDKSDATFITSDHPVTLVPSNGKPPPSDTPLVFDMKETMLVFPVTKKIVALGTFEGMDSVVKLGTAQVAFLNGLVTMACDRQIYASSNAVPISFSLEGPIHKGSEVLADLTERARDE
jgi:hypothetical protein